jgi:serine/threonine protein phosphatase PrpC
MGSCIHKKQSQSIDLKNDSNQRRFSSILIQPEEKALENRFSLFDDRVDEKSLIEKVSQGSLVVLDKSILLSGLLSNKKQQGFEDKRVSINSQSFSFDDLPKVGISVTCKKGLKPEFPNQDDYFVFIDKDFIILGVFDGHGVLGHKVSDFVHNALPGIILSQPDLLKDSQSALKKAFDECQNKLLNNDENIDCSVSGCTATVLLIIQGKMFIAHIGDSRAVICEEVNNSIASRNLTKDHKPNLPEEEERIKFHGGEVKQLSDDAPFRIFRPGQDFPGINMSRAFGDVLSRELGVIHVPEVNEIKMKVNDSFILICSDGIWEFITGQESANLVFKCQGDAKKACEKLAALAWMRWKKKYDNLVDDITVIVVYLKNPFIQQRLAVSSTEQICK